MLAVENLHLYYGASHCLRGVSLQAVKGQITCLLGRNGVGKTSLLRTIMGQRAPRSGKIVWEEKPLDGFSPSDRARRGIGFVPQGREIFPLLTVEENLKTGFAALPRDQRSIPSETYDLFPVLKSMLKRRGGDLSGGQQQQLAIGRALVTRPKLLVLDEPTEGIQPSIIKDIGRAISWLRTRGDMAILLVEQYFDFVHQLADTFAVMDRGEIVLSGRREDMDETKVRRYLTV